MSRSRDTADQINRVDSSAANSTAITIDSSENVLVGGTSSGADGAVTLSNTGYIQARIDNDTVAYFDRTGAGDFGEIIRLQQNGSTVGSLGIQSSGFYIDGEANHAGIRFSGNQVTPRLNGSDDNGNIILGGASNRFKDLYLSGGVYLGGTGAANKLDSYEEGNWTPTAASGGTISTLHRAVYIKIGNFVNAYAYINITAPNDTNNLNVGGLPFTSRNLADYYGGGSGPSYSGSVNTSSWGSPLVSPNTTTLYWHSIAGSADVIKNNFNSGNDMALIFNIQYFT